MKSPSLSLALAIVLLLIGHEVSCASPARDSIAGKSTLRAEQPKPASATYTDTNAAKLSEISMQHDFRDALTISVLVLSVILISTCAHLYWKNTKMAQKLQASNFKILQQNNELSVLSLQLIQRSNGLKEIEKELRMLIDEHNLEYLKKILKLLNTKKTAQKEWDDFSKYFLNIHQDFFARLTCYNSKLSLQEKRLCSLIKMNLDNRDIALLGNIEASSVKINKYRLKRKLGLDKNANLAEFISKF